MTEETNQRQAVFDYLREHGSITSKEAFELFGATRLSAIVCDWRKRGINIQTLMIDGKTRYGSSCKYAKYIYSEEKN